MLRNYVLCKLIKNTYLLYFIQILYIYIFNKISVKLFFKKVIFVKVILGMYLQLDKTLRLWLLMIYNAIFYTIYIHCYEISLGRYLLNETHFFW